MAIPVAVPPALAVVGPTASGKAALGREIAERLAQPIFVCDSVKIYRGLDIGSAKPTPQARKRVPHHLIDIKDPSEDFTAGAYAEAAWTLWQQHRGIFVGGTGLYLRTTAWTQTGDSTPRDDPRRARFEDDWIAQDLADPGAAHRALTAQDPETAASVHPNNRVRVVRALWLCHAHRGPVSALRREDPPRPRLRLMLLVLDPGLEALESRIARRVDQMLEDGWLAEVEGLRAAGYHEGHKAMRSLGYRQLLDVVAGRADLPTARDAIVVATRQYAKRQRTYFRHQLPASDVVHLTDPADVPWQRVRAHVDVGG